MRTLFVAICLTLATAACAQRACAGTEYIEQQKSIDPSFSRKIAEVENFVRLQAATSAKQFGGGGVSIIRIPVVVHILYNTAAQNISDAQVQSQIDVLNRDFRRKNVDTSKTPERFRVLAADVQIEFALATADPAGRATSGIVRKKTSVTEWKVDDKIKFAAQGGDDAWDSRSYLNIWVGNFRTVLGYASVPGTAAEKDGIAINVSAFGTINVAAPYDLGRTAVHEAGHWLGLKHIWGDTYCGDDGIDDTPRQGNFTPGCPSGFRSSCDNGTQGDMYMNYMDFTGDACLNLFTNGQKQRMLALFNAGGPHAGLLSSKGLQTPWTTEAPVPATEMPSALPAGFRFYPNPVHNEISFDLSGSPEWIGKTLTIVNLNGVVLHKMTIGSGTQKVNVSALQPGLYFIQGDNGRQKIRAKFMKL